MAMGPKGRPIVPMVEKIKSDAYKLGKKRHGGLPSTSKKVHKQVRKVPR